jgi:hypothetical protein
MAIVRGLCTLDEARIQIFGATESTAPHDRDELIEDFISSATPIVETIVGPMYAESRTYTADGGKASIKLPYRFNAVTSVTVDGVALTAYVPDATAGLIYAGTELAPTEFSPGLLNVDVEVTVGYATIPPNVKMMAREVVKHWWQQGQQGNRPAFGDGSSEPAVQFGVPTRRLMELAGGSEAVGGFA